MHADPEISRDVLPRRELMACLAKAASPDGIFYEETARVPRDAKRWARCPSDHRARSGTLSRGYSEDELERARPTAWIGTKSTLDLI